MNPEQWQKIKSILEDIADKVPSERSALIETYCGDDIALRKEVESLLEYYECEEAILSEGIARAARDIIHSHAAESNNAENASTEEENLVGKLFDNQYRIEALLGQGGIGVVYRARHSLLNHLIAIKVLRRHLGSNPEYKKLLMREGRAMTLFNHPNIVAVHDLRESNDGTLYIVLEYVDGHTLKEELAKRKRFSPKEAFETLSPVASALSAAHSIGVVHRDLKPSNIIVGKTIDGTPTIKLLDLGIAKFLNKEGQRRTGMLSMTATGLAVGTPQYMSPEQWENEEIDERTDIYSLGLIFYELVNGRLPEELTKSERFLAWSDEFKITPLHLLHKDVPIDFSLAIAKATAKDRNKRYSSCQEMLDAVRTALKIDPSNPDFSDRPEADIAAAAERLYAALSRAQERGCDRKKIKRIARDIASRLLEI
ncbi:MAG: serine/threonine-protein kinase [Acidobacteriota bacterium]|nr:serine/threonine protein kinase [Blastocatellia bacterium]MDW8412562.1 serine/threonine-protein kinase [Acidobacteriota bacterium]